MEWMVVVTVLTASSVARTEYEKSIFQPEEICNTEELGPFYNIECRDLKEKAESNIFKKECNITCDESMAKIAVSCKPGGWNQTDVCKNSERKLIRKKRFFSSILRGLGCLFFKWCGRRRDSKPPELRGCPSSFTKYAEQLKNYKKVTWVLPSAYDQKDGNVIVHTSPRTSGSVFYEGTTKIGHYAFDESGNMAKCFFNIHISVIRCPKPGQIVGGFFQCFPQHDFRRGTKCRFGCYKGYTLFDVEGITCKKDGNRGRWSEQQPKCKKINCENLPPVQPPMNFSCTDKNKYGSVCTYRCRKGFSVAHGTARVRICRHTGKWSGNQEPMCIDSDPPILHSCAGTITGYADKDSDSTIMVWDKPNVTDNVDTDLKVKLVTGPEIGDRLTVGTYKAVYSATDKAGNNAKQCVVNIVVKQILCPRLYAKPYTKFLCPTGNRLGATCEIKCLDGAVLNGSSTVSCIQVDGKNYGQWDWGDYEPHCKVLKSCAKSLDPPLNGALACDYWLGGKFCQMLCQKGYDIKPGYKVYTIFVCSESGAWTPSDEVPNCYKNHGSRVLSSVMSVSYYFSGDCLDPIVRNEIKHNFIQVLTNSFYPEFCTVFADRCSYENVQVLCGGHSRKRSVHNLELQFIFEVELQHDIDDNVYSNITSSQYDAQLTLAEKIKQGELDFDLHGNFSTKAVEVNHKGIDLVCPLNMVPSYSTLSCVECPKGTFYDNSTRTCRLCEKGFYQEKAAQPTCNKCPLKTTTRESGASDILECKESCEPGHSSQNGLPPCKPCEIGSYQEDYGATECNFCKGSKTTKVEGSTAARACEEFDVVFAGNQTDMEEGITFNISTSRNVKNFNISLWFQIEERNDSIALFKVIDSDFRFSVLLTDQLSVHSPCGDFDISLDLSDGNWHYVKIVVSNNSMKIQLDDMHKFCNECCLEITPSTIATIGDLSFMGRISQFNIWSHDSADGIEFGTSRHCWNKRKADLLSWKQFEAAKLAQTTYFQIPSECIDTNNCKDDPCNNGTCINSQKAFRCICNMGYTGDVCEVNIDDCIEHVCENNGICIDGIGSYICECGVGFKGKYCEIPVVNGNWTSWSVWTQCSQSCDTGMRSRSRLCNNPEPMNGGMQCIGSDTEKETCFLEMCPSCIDIQAPPNSTVSCYNDSETINCTLECQNGFQFDREPLEFYTCGPDTFYKWPFQTDDNPTARLPSCNPTEDATALSVTYQARYIDLFCDNKTESKVKRNIQSSALDVVKNLTCNVNGNCTIKDIVVTNCDYNDTIMYKDGNTVGLTMKFECDPKSSGSEDCYTVLITALNDVVSYAYDGSLNVDVEGQTYVIEKNSSLVSGETSCPRGRIDVSFYCVPCSPGNYHDGENCNKCDFGTYQPERGKTVCLSCPKGYITTGKGSIALEECLDIMPPVILGCPQDMKYTVKYKSNVIVLAWEIPTAEDNSGKLSSINQTSGPLRGQSFVANVSQMLLVEYIIKDGSENNSTCSFSIQLEVLPDDEVSKTVTSKNFIGAVVGGSVGLLALLLVILMVYLYRTSRFQNYFPNKKRKTSLEGKEENDNR